MLLIKLVVGSKLTNPTGKPHSTLQGWQESKTQVSIELRIAKNINSPIFVLVSTEFWKAGSQVGTCLNTRQPLPKRKIQVVSLTSSMRVVCSADAI